MDRFPVVLEKDDGTVAVSFPDVSQAHTFGADEVEVMSRAQAALETAIIALMAARKDIPRPSPARGRPTVSLPLLSVAKVELYRAMRRAKVNKAELARRLGWHGPQVDRLLDLRHASHIRQIDAALKAIGKTIEINVRSTSSSQGTHISAD